MSTQAILDKIDEIGETQAGISKRNQETLSALMARIELIEAESDRPKGGASDAEKEKQTKAFLAYLRDGDSGGLSKSTKSVNIATGAAGGFAVPELIDQTIGYPKYPAIHTDVLTQNDDAVIFFHFLPQGQVKRLHHRHLSHYPSPYSTRRVPV